MPSSTRPHNDFGLILGLKSTDRLLNIEGRSQVKKLLLEGRQFDKIIGRFDDAETVLHAIQMLVRGGLIAVLEFDQDLSAAQSLISSNYPLANVWTVRTSIGEVLVTDAFGNPVEK